MAVKRDLFSPLEEDYLNENERDMFEESFEEQESLFSPAAEEQLLIQEEIDQFFYELSNKRIFSN
jgi:3-oxoacyl-[acyl-carrier-protein] synthase III